jgi:hypothetical protein
LSRGPRQGRLTRGDNQLDETVGNREELPTKQNGRNETERKRKSGRAEKNTV